MQADEDTATAIILITTEPGQEAAVYEAISHIPEVVDQLLLFGEYDVYARLECESFGILGGVVINRIRSIEGVDSTKTLTAAPVN